LEKGRMKPSALKSGNKSQNEYSLENVRKKECD
jgi:hypothetical protein